MTKEEYLARLAKADWYYQFSDDGAVWRRGEAEFAELEALAKANGWEAEFEAARKR